MENLIEMLLRTPPKKRDLSRKSALSRHPQVIFKDPIRDLKLIQTLFKPIRVVRKPPLWQEFLPKLKKKHRDLANNDPPIKLRSYKRRRLIADDLIDEIEPVIVSNGKRKISNCSKGINDSKQSQHDLDEITVTPLNLKRAHMENRTPIVVVRDILEDCLSQVCCPKPIFNPDPCSIPSIVPSMPMVEELRDWKHPKRRISDLVEEPMVDESIPKERPESLANVSNGSFASDNDTLIECNPTSEVRTDSSEVSILSDKELNSCDQTISEAREIRGEISAFGRACEDSHSSFENNTSSTDYPPCDEGLLFSDLESRESEDVNCRFWSVANSPQISTTLNWRPSHWPEIASDESSSRVENSLQSCENQENIASFHAVSTPVSPERLTQGSNHSLEPTITPIVRDLRVSSTTIIRTPGLSPFSDQPTSQPQFIGMKKRLVQSCPTSSSRMPSPLQHHVPTIPILLTSPPRNSGQSPNPMIETPSEPNPSPSNDSHATPQTSLMVPNTPGATTRGRLARIRRISPRCLRLVQGPPSSKFDAGFPGWNLLPTPLNPVNLGPKQLAKSPCTRMILQKNSRMTEMTCWNGALKMFKIMRE